MQHIVRTTERMDRDQLRTYVGSRHTEKNYCVVSFNVVVPTIGFCEIKGNTCLILYIVFIEYQSRLLIK